RPAATPATTGRCGAAVDPPPGGQGLFFSSRRRHTRLQGDWSSRRVLFRSVRGSRRLPSVLPTVAADEARTDLHPERRRDSSGLRSEERRVGKGGRGIGGRGAEERRAERSEAREERGRVRLVETGAERGGGS